MSTQDDELKLEPPQAPAPHPPGPSLSGEPPPAPFPPGPSVAGQPPAPFPPGPPAPGRTPASDLQPGAGRPMVEGPPMSVSEPISDSSINRTAAFAGIGLLGLGLIVVVVLLLVSVFAVCAHR
jgi:hypothetical protein